eukprot:4274275-Pyramimonas_sp.AAC.1
MSHVHKQSSSPLRQSSGRWAIRAREKASFFARSFQSKWSLPAAALNEFTDCSSILLPPDHCPCVIRRRTAFNALKLLRPDSGTGPDLLPARVLKECAQSLAVPVSKLARLILRTGVWPLAWREHWVHPLHKRRALSDPDNYRGIQLTAQLSK